MLSFSGNGIVLINFKNPNKRVSDKRDSIGDTSPFTFKLQINNTFFYYKKQTFLRINLTIPNNSHFFKESHHAFSNFIRITFNKLLD